MVGFSEIISNGLIKKQEAQKAPSGSIKPEVAVPITIAGRLSSYLSHLSDGTSKNFRSIEEVVIETLKRIEQAHRRGSLVTGIPTVSNFTITVSAVFILATSSRRPACPVTLSERNP